MMTWVDAGKDHPYPGGKDNQFLMDHFHNYKYVTCLMLGGLDMETFVRQKRRSLTRALIHVLGGDRNSLDCIDDIFRSGAGAFASVSFSQEGEDLLLRRFFPDRDHGFFVDVGAHHPIRFSNTWRLYLRGWNGINIDATPGSMELFMRLRPRDINMECAVSERSESLRFHLFKEKALNTFDSSLAANYVKHGWEMLGTLELCPRPLAGILAECLPPGRKIDFMSVDVEGEELAFLSSYDGSKSRPASLALEILAPPWSELFSHPVIVFLAKYNYLPISRLFNSVFLMDAKAPLSLA